MNSVLRRPDVIESVVRGDVIPAGQHFRHDALKLDQVFYLEAASS
jgi:hypothetical protein